jgi:putative hydrolase of the HAD superfamily
MTCRAVIFDLFGTLVENFTAAQYAEMLAGMADAVGVPREAFARLWSDTAFARNVGEFATAEENIAYICHTLGVAAPNEHIRAAAELRWQAIRTIAQPRADAAGTLAQLKARGIRLGLISDCGAEGPRLWAELPFAGLIDVPIFSCVAGVKKPDPRIYRLACTTLGVEPAECLYVGDGGSHELTGASRLGMRAVLLRVPWDHLLMDGRPDACEWRGAVISTLHEVLALLA